MSQPDDQPSALRECLEQILSTLQKESMGWIADEIQADIDQGLSS